MSNPEPERPSADEGPVGIDQNKKQNPRDFDEAFYAALLSRAQSDPARQLVQGLAEIVESHELAVGIRANRSIAKLDKLKIAVERFLADLLCAQATERSKGYVYRSMRPKGFTNGEVGFRTFRRLVKSLADLGMVEVFKGFQTSSELGPYIRKATRFRTTKRLLELCEQHGVRPADFHQHFAVPLPEHPLQLWGKVKRTQFGDRVRGRLMPFEPTPRTDRLEKQVKDLNRFFDTVELRGGAHRGYLRIFNNGDDPNFDWDMGGRLYSHLEGNYQQMDGRFPLDRTSVRAFRRFGSASLSQRRLLRRSLGEGGHSSIGIWHSRRN